MQKYIQLFKKSWQDKHFGYILKGSLSTAVTLLFVQGLRFISGVLIARFYGAEASGRLTLVVTVMGVFALFANFGIRDALQKLIPEYMSRYNLKTAYRVFWKGIFLVSLLSIISGLVLYAIAPWLCVWWNEPDLLPYFRWSAFFLFFFVLSEYFYFCLRATFKVHTANLTLIAPTIIRLLALFAMTYFCFHRDNPIYLHWITLCLLPFLFSILPIYKNLFTPSKNEPILYEASYNTLFQLAVPMLMTYSLFLINNSADVFMMKYFGTPTAKVGIYKSCVNISALAATLLVSLNTTVQPKFTQLYYQHNFEEIKRLTRKTSKLTFYISLPIFLVLIFLAKYIMALYGKDFTLGAMSLSILTIGQVFNTACGPTAQLLNATGFHKQFRNISFLGAFINIILNLLLIPRYGIEGAAIANAVSMLSWNIISAWYIKNKFGFFSGYIPFFS